MNIYVASSCSNRDVQHKVVHALRKDKHEVYDFLHPSKGVPGFFWDQVDTDHERWTHWAFLQGLQSNEAFVGFNRNMQAMKSCDACVLVLPCGRSAHLEAGWCAGKDKLVYVYGARDMWGQDLMYLALTGLYTEMSALREELTLRDSEIRPLVTDPDSEWPGNSISAQEGSTNP